MKVDGQSQPFIRAKVTNDFVDYAHNDVANAAWFIRERLAKTLENENEGEGVFLDMIALVTMTAFTLEGYANFIGKWIIDRDNSEKDALDIWNKFERIPIKEKIKSIQKMLDIEMDWNKRPYETVDSLISLRNMFAHPKSHPAKEREQILVGTDAKLRQLLRDHKPEYEERLTWEFANIAYNDVEAIWRGLLSAAQIELHQTWSGGSQGIELIEVLDHPSAQPDATPP